MSGFLFNLGRHIGKKAVPAIRKSKWIWNGLTGDEGEAMRAEAALGADMAQELRETLPLCGREPQSVQVREVCEALSARVKDQRRTFRCETFQDPFPNAMALPGGFIFISDALLDLCGGQQGQLAFVLGHEMAHVIRKHAWDKVVNEAALRVASAATARAGMAGGLLRKHGLRLLKSAYSQDCEFEADELGARLAIAAGYGGAGAIAILERMEARNSGAAQAGEFMEYLRSHPPVRQRVARLKTLLTSLKA